MATKPRRHHPSGETPRRHSVRSAASDIMTVEQVAQYLQLNKLTVYKYVREGRIPAAKLGKAYRIRRSDVDWFLEAQKMRPGREPQRGKARQPAQAAVATRPAEEIMPGSRRPEPASPRERELPLNPMEWVIRELH